MSSDTAQRGGPGSDPTRGEESGAGGVSDPTVPFGLLGWMALFVVLGSPLVYFVWRFVNELLAGEFRAGTAALAAGGLVGLIGLLAVVARKIRRWEESP